jgi:hypothetical protein
MRFQIKAKLQIIQKLIEVWFVVWFIANHD